MERVYLLKAGIIFLFITLIGARNIWSIHKVQYAYRESQKHKSMEIKNSDKKSVTNDVDSKIFFSDLESTWSRMDIRHAKRGRILARDKETVLADNVKVARVIVEKQLLKNEDEVYSKLSSFLNQSPQSIRELIEANQNLKRIDLAYDIPQETAEQIDALSLPGIFIRYYFQRYYPFKDNFAPHIIGYRNLRNELSIGLELTFSEYLKGRDGIITYESDGRGRIIPATLTYTQPQDGNDLVTTLDRDIQLAAEKTVAELMKRTRGKWALVAVMDPFTGEILSSAVRPSFDPNEYSRGPSRGKEANPLTQFVFEPGSIMKPLVTAVALDRGWLSEEEKFYCTPTFRIGKYVIHEAEHDRNPAGFGHIPVRNIIVHSSNVGMAQIGLKLGQYRLEEIFKTLGLYEQSAIELNGEKKGIKPVGFKSGKKVYVWPDITVATSAFGQGIALTPLQLMRAFSAIANGGILPKVTVVLKGEESQYQPKERIPLLPGERIVSASTNSEVKLNDNFRRVISPETAEKVRDILREAVEKGTGKRARMQGYTVAGKTGTGQIAEGGEYQKGIYTSSFIGFFPKREPRYLILVVVREPKGDYYGGLVSAPAFRELAEKIVLIKRIAPETIDETL